MPNVIVKLWPGKSEEQTKELAEQITKAVVSTLNYGEFRLGPEVKARDWTEQIYKADILAEGETICKEPGYGP